MLLTIEFITPQIAINYLAKNKANRPVSQKIINHYKNEMKKGNWLLTSETIAFSDKDRLIDGQHRLNAIASLSNELDFKGVSMSVIREAKEEIFDVIGQGSRRGASDVLSLHGFTNNTIMAALTKRIIAYNSGKYARASAGHHAGYIDVNKDILLFCQENNLDKYIQDSGVFSRKSKVLDRGSWAFFYYILSQSKYKGSFDFLNKLSIGAGLEENNAILVLRNQLIKEYSSQEKNSARTIFAWVIKAWNIWVKNKTTNKITYLKEEEFPVIF